MTHASIDRALRVRRAADSLTFFIVALIATAALESPAQAWDSAGHRTITFLAMDGLAELAPDRPAFLADDTSRQIAAFQASEADRYRALRSPVYLKHENDPDHFIDIEDLERFGLTLESLPPLRYEYLRAMAIAKHEHPEQAAGDPDVPPYNERRDVARTQEFPGYGPYAVMEHHGKLAAAFKTYRALEKLSDPIRAAQMEATKANILAEMGHLSHFVGDLAQPLHTTRHYNGWVGKNPSGYTTDKGFHAYIDGGVVALHGVNYALLQDRASFGRKIDDANPFNDVLAHIRRSHDQMERLYMMQKSGELQSEPGKALICDRFLDGASMLAAMYASAWSLSALAQDDAANLVKYDGLIAEPGGPQPAAQPGRATKPAGDATPKSPEEAERAWEQVRPNGGKPE